jgi:hypothetical protein
MNALCQAALLLYIGNNLSCGIGPSNGGIVGISEHITLLSHDWDIASMLSPFTINIIPDPNQRMIWTGNVFKSSTESHHSVRVCRIEGICPFSSN